MFKFYLIHRRKLIAAFIVILYSLQLNAQLVTPELAQKVAANFYNSQMQSDKNFKSADVDQLSLAKVCYSKQTLKNTDEEKIPLYYIFNIEDDKGFIIVSGRNGINPVIGYSTNGEFPKNKKHPIYDWIEFMKIRLSSRLENKSTGLDTNNIKFNSQAYATVGPLLGNIEWDQGAPYYCYVVDLYDEFVPMGCVAIACAQIMQYYKYPLIGIGNMNYKESGNDPKLGNIYVNFEDNYYNWHLFEDKIEFRNDLSCDNEKSGVSEVIFEIAASLETDFGNRADDGSVAYIENVFGADAHHALEDYFGFKGIEYNGTGLTTSFNEWKNLIINELNDHRPIIYSANDGIVGEGHAFICDGYDSENRFHFNWGWRGEGNGWFLLDSMQPDVRWGDPDYSYEIFLTSMLTGIAPDFDNPAIDQFEPDNTYNKATTLEHNKPQLHSISPQTDRDYYKFILTSSANVTIETKGVNGNTQMWLYDSNQQYMDYDDDSGDSGSGPNSKLVRQLSKGTYYVMVEEKGGDANIPSYVISLDVEYLPTNEPQLSNISFSPQTGDQSTTFNFYVDYYDANGDAPEQNGAECCIIGEGCKTMQRISGTPSNGTYRYSIQLPIGSHQFKYNFTNTVGERVETEYMQGPIVTQEVENRPPNKPTLITPENGITVSVPFTFSWDCTDPDGDQLTYNFAIRKDGGNWDSEGFTQTSWEITEELDENEYGTYDWYIMASDGEFETQSDIWTFIIQENTPSINVNDSLALVALYNLCNGNNWTNNSNWLTTPVKDWYGITVENARVTQINLSNNNLAYHLPEEIGNLTELVKLDVGKNNLEGTIPTEIGNLTNLVYLILGDNYTGVHNKFTGEIPIEIGNLKKLMILILDFNELSGEIPDEIWNLENLIYLRLQGNQFTGRISNKIGNLSNLQLLWLGKNQLIGNIPQEIGNLSRLIYLSLMSNKLTGEIPESIDQLTNLKSFNAADNELSLIPNSLGNLSGLYSISLHNNQFTGAVPSTFTNLSNLELINLRNNKLTDIPDLSNLKNLVRVDLSSNSFSFEDLEANMNITLNTVGPSGNQFGKGFYYSPQNKIGEAYSLEINEEQDYTLSVDCGGTNNQYQWFKNDIALNNPNSDPRYIINSFGKENEGIYTCKISNSLVPDLVLESYPITLTMQDLTAPTLSVTPLSSSNLPNQFSVFLTFSEDVTGVVEGISVTNGVANITGTGKNYTVIINAEDNTEVTLFIANTVTDMAGNHFEGMSYNYSVGDNTPPVMTACYPNDTIIDDNHPTFNFSFNEEIVLGSGSLRVYQKNGTTTPTLSIPFVENMIDGKNVSVTYESSTNRNFELNTEYFVTINAGSFADLSGNIFEGIKDSDTWHFKTGTNYATSIKMIVDNSINIYPNPVSQHLNIEFTTMPRKYEIEFYNTVGQMVIQKQSANQVEQLNLKELTNGIYYLKIYNEEFSKTEKIIVK